MPWTDTEAEGLKGNPILEKYETRDLALHGLIDAQDLIGKKGILPPGEGANPEQIEAFKSGITEHKDAILPILVQVPGKPEEYEIKVPEDAPKGLEKNEALLTGFKGKAHELGLTKEQAAGLGTWFNQFQIDMFTEGTKAGEKIREESETSLRTDFGKDYDDKLKRNQLLLKRFADEETQKFYEESGLIKHPGTFKMFDKFLGVISEDVLKGSPGDKDFEGDLSEEKLKQMMKDPRYADQYKRDPEFVKKVTEGWKKLYPGTRPGS